MSAELTQFATGIGSYSGGGTATSQLTMKPVARPTSRTEEVWKIFPWRPVTFASYWYAAGPYSMCFEWVS